MLLNSDYMPNTTEVVSYTLNVKSFSTPTLVFKAQFSLLSSFSSFIKSGSHNSRKIAECDKKYQKNLIPTHKDI